ncbi:MAG: FAD-dependent oxidoreductase, partial [Alphaproteobacteria bacterium]
MSREFDLVVLGTGNAGMAAAGVAREAGRSVAMVESWDVGGTCPLRGCVPKKVLVAAAQVLHQIERAPLHHIEVGTVALDWAKLIARERTFVDGVPEAFAASLENRGIELVRGRARFGAAHRLEVDGETLETGKIVIATGSKPRPLAIPGA